jgi:FkbM family methyltransferase
MNWELLWQVGPVPCAARAVVRLASTRMLRVGNSVRLSRGLRMDLPPGYSNGTEVYLTQGRVDWGSEALLLQHLDPEGVFIDVGANIGYYAMTVAPGVAQVYAFEPDPRNRVPLERNAATAGNMTVVGKAVAASSGIQWLRTEKDSALSHLLTDRANCEGAVEVETTSLDDFVASRVTRRVTAIKIDVEGFDLDVLVGSWRTLRVHQPLVLSEFNRGPALGNTFAGLFDLTSSLGYEVFAFARVLDRWRRPTDCLRALQPDSAEGEYLKMLFLVPRRLQPGFRELSERN